MGNRSVRICRYMAKELHNTEEFEVLLKPMMNILLYRYLPTQVRGKLRCANPSYHGLSDAEWEEIDQADISLQERQKADGKTLVSRTTVYSPHYQRSIVVLRVVIGNPLTEEADIDEVISEQLRIASGQPKDLTPANSSGQLHRRLLHDSQQDKCGHQYWERMSRNAKLFFLEDSARFCSSHLAPDATCTTEKDSASSMRAPATRTQSTRRASNRTTSSMRAPCTRTTSTRPVRSLKAPSVAAPTTRTQPMRAALALRVSSGMWFGANSLRRAFS